MTVPDEAVEAAAEYLPHSSDCEVRPERDCTCWQLRVNLMREALTAAAPFIAAQALSEAAEELTGKRLLAKPAHEYYPEWLNKKADAIRSEQ